jgi:hypothetical protein
MPVPRRNPAQRQPGWQRRYYSSTRLQERAPEGALSHSIGTRTSFTLESPNSGISERQRGSSVTYPAERRV